MAEFERMSTDRIIRRATHLIMSGHELMPPELLEVARQIIGPCPQCASRTHPQDAYQAEVLEIAQELTAQVRDGDVLTREDLLDTLLNICFESGLLTSPNSCMDILRYSPNSGYAVENFGDMPTPPGGGIPWDYLAGWALYADVMNHPEAPDFNDPFECRECGAAYDNYGNAQECCSEEFECPECGSAWNDEESANACCQNVENVEE